MHLVEPLAVPKLEEAHVLPVDAVYHSFFGVGNCRNLKWKESLGAQKAFVFILDETFHDLILVEFEDVVVAQELAVEPTDDHDFVT